MLPIEYPPDIKRWLNKRGISDEVLNHNNISVVDRQIKIPIYSPDKKFLFNKFRRDPFSEDGPKYRYEKGATAALYNANNLWLGSGSVFIVEGELDAMRLQSGGHFAVSTTGGSGTFKKEWSETLRGYQIYICYDNDSAGVLGSIRLIEIFPDARVIELPREAGVKDVTDYLSKHEDGFVSLVNGAKTFAVPKENENLKQYKKDLAASCNAFRVEANEGRSQEIHEALIAILQGRYDAVVRQLNHRTVAPKDGAALVRARAVPIPNYVKFDRQGYAKCVAHTDKTPSMKYYKKNNKVKCFGCGFNGDTIDVVSKVFNITVGEAIKKING